MEGELGCGGDTTLTDDLWASSIILPHSFTVSQ